MRKVLYYVHDPMCSWCWGFRPTWKKIVSKITEDAKDIEIRMLLGGLAPDSDIPMSEAMKVEIAGYWRKIQKHIPGTEFNFDFWKDCKPKRSTYPACRAVIAARKQNSNIEQEMIEAIQKAYYLHAENPSEIETLYDIAISLGLDGDVFVKDAISPETQDQLDKEILFSRQIGAQGFPSMILKRGDEYHYVPLDYNDPTKALDFINAD